jgi:hypothetical protein
MTRAMTDGVVLMPPPFARGLDCWSRGDGTPGSASYEGAPDAAIVADPDLGLSLQLATAGGTRRLRHMRETPLLPGRSLRIRVRVKALYGAFPTVRIAGWPGGAGGAAVPGLVTAGPAVALAAKGQVVEVEAIVGSGPNPGVQMAWGRQVLYGHFGLDLIASGAGVVRVGDIVIEDVTSAAPTR